MKNIILLIETDNQVLTTLYIIYVYTRDPFIYLSFIGLW